MKNKREIDWSYIMTRAIQWGIFSFFSFVMFVPEDGKIRNLPILFTIIGIFVLHHVWKLVRYLCLMNRCKRLFKPISSGSIQTKINIFSSGLHGHYSMVVHSDQVTYHIVFILKRRRNRVYSFDSPEHLNLYKISRSMTIVNRQIGNYAQGGEFVRCVGKQTFKWPQEASENQVNIMMFDKMPASVSSGSWLEAGMMLCDNSTYVYDYPVFSKKFDSILEQHRKEL